MAKGNSLWDLAIEQENAKTQAGPAGDGVVCSEDSAIFIVGSKSSGKTSIILRFLDRDEVPKPTVALEYTFGRRAKGHNIAKDVGHIWELGGGTWLAKLMDIPINPDTIMHTSLVIVLDLSAPKQLWFTLESLLAAAKSRIETVIAEMKETNVNIREKLKGKAWERIGTDHHDKSLIDPFLIPLIIVGSKYDVFQDFDPEKRKVICKTLRFVAHFHGASIQFFSTKIEHLVKRTQSIISHQLFGTNTSKSLHTELNKPLMVPFGLDSLQEIGNPPIPDQDIGRIHAKTPMDLWKAAYTSYFPQENTNNPAMVDDPAKDPQFAEPVIDSLRAQKDDDLERYRRLSERRAKEAINFL